MTSPSLKTTGNFQEERLSRPKMPFLALMKAKRKRIEAIFVCGSLPRTEPKVLVLGFSNHHGPRLLVGAGQAGILKTRRSLKNSSGRNMICTAEPKT